MWRTMDISYMIRRVIPTPTKVIATHLTYRSRAAERGKMPVAPSYFLKPPSSLALGGGEVRRPEGCHLLAFEGEIALVIGTRCLAGEPGAGWESVGWVTAANDFGVYDLRYADAGSNLRSKGSDGFTPCGPEFIPADRVDPHDLLLRTWVNGVLQQQARTGEELLFSFDLLIADLARLMTLEPGDIVLRVHGSKIHDADELVDRLSGFSPGDKVRITILRSGESFRKTVTLSGPSDIRKPAERLEVKNRMNKDRKIILRREIRDTVESPEKVGQTVERSIKTEGSRKLNVSLSSSSADTDKGRLDIRFEGAKMPLSVKVLDPDGREVFSDKVDDDSGRYGRIIEVKMMKGTTLVQVWQDGKCSTVKINVE